MIKKKLIIELTSLIFVLVAITLFFGVAGIISKLRGIVVIGALTSSIYALLAMGFTLIFGAARLINMAHTALYMMAAYFIYVFTKLYGLGTISSVILAVVLTTLIGMGIYRFLINRVREHELTVLIITVAVALIIHELVVLLISSESVGVAPFVPGKIELIGVSVTMQEVFILAVNSLLVFVMWAFITKTGIGIAIRATAQDTEAANLMGINVGKIYLIAMGMATLLAAIAGALIAPRGSLLPDRWMPSLIIVLSIVVVGGLGSLKGSIIASLILGYVETSVTFLYPEQAYLEGVIALVFMILVLIIRPAGLFGVSFEEERL